MKTNQNSSKPTKPRTSKSSKMKMEALEPRMLMSGVVDEFMAGIENLDTSVANYITLKVANNTDVASNKDIIAGLSAIGAAQGIRLSDLVDLSKVTEMAAHIEKDLKQGVLAAKNAAELAASAPLTVTDLVDAINKLPMTTSVAAGITATVKAVDNNGKIDLDLSLDWVSDKTAPTVNLGPMDGPVSDIAKDLTIGANLHLSASIGAGGVDLNDSTTFAAEVRYTQKNDGPVLQYGMMSLGQVDKQIGTAPETEPDLRLGLKFDSLGAMTKIAIADLDFEIKADAKIAGMTAATGITLKGDGLKSWTWETPSAQELMKDQMEAFKQVAMDKVLAKLQGVSTWLGKMTREMPLLQTDFGGLLSQNLGQMLDLSELMDSVLNRDQGVAASSIPISVLNIDRGSAGAIEYDGTAHTLTVPFVLKLSASDTLNFNDGFLATVRYN
jgi:hypothetical protein